MGLKGDRKRVYQKHYMRRRRAIRPFHSLAFINRRLEELGFPQAVPAMSPVWRSA